MTKSKHFFRQRIPGFIDPRGLVPEEFYFDTTEELVNHPFIQGWLDRHNPSNLVKDEKYLIVEYNEGFNWWVIGYITNSDDLQVPEWTGGKWVVQYENGQIEVLTKESKNPVIRTCGDEITLKDGTKCKDIRYEDWKND